MKPVARFSPTVDRFLVARFLYPLIVSLAGFSAIYLLGDVFDRFDDLVRYGGFSRFGLLYFTFKLPLIVTQLLPVACLAAVLLTFAMLNRSGEVLALHSLGMSRLKIAAPVLVAAIAVSVLDFGFSETVVPFATRQSRYLYSVEIKHRELKGVFANRDIWMRAGDGFLSVDHYDSQHQRLEGVTVYHMDPEFNLRDVHRATQAQWDGRGWTLSGAQVYRLLDGGKVSTVGGDELRLEVTPADFGLVRQDPEEFSLAELNRYIHGLRRKGLDPGGYVVDRDLKYAAPISCLIMAALAIVLSLDPLPRRLALGKSFAQGIAIGFAYWLALGFTSSFGRSGLIPAWLAAWSPNLLFAALAISIFLFGEEGRAAVQRRGPAPTPGGQGRSPLRR